jgi:undecaprenyl-diphosphatase
VTLEARLWTLAVLFAAAFFILAILVTSTHALNRLDAAGLVLRGQSTGLAAIFTLSGRALPLLGLGLLSVLLFFALRQPLWVPLAIFASQLVSQGAVELVKHIFSRARPDDWLVTHDLGFSFPSGHATTAIVFFGMWLLVVMVLPIDRPLKFALAGILLVWMIGIDWSRIALGAHYISDVLGGTLFGSAWTCALLALLLRLRIPIPWLTT